VADRSALSIVFAAAPGEVGGLETVVAGLACGLQRRGHRVVVAAVVEPDRDPTTFLHAFGDTDVDLRVFRLPARAYREEWRLFRELYDEVRPDVVHSHGHRSDLLDAMVAKRAGHPIVTTLHGSSRFGGRSRVYEWVQLLSLRRFDAVVAVSRALVTSAAGRWVGPQRLHLIPNARERGGVLLGRAEARQALGLQDSWAVAGWVGRLIPVKAVETLVDAVRLIDHPALHVALVGDGPERQALEQRAEALGVGPQVTFCGTAPDAGTMFRAFDVFVMTSTSEGTPMVLLEAVAAEVPVVATRVGGIPDVLGSGGGLLVEPGDPAALARAITDSLGDGARATERARLAAARLDREYSAELWLSRHEELYYSLQ
jgi:glycosyltransferase involved in cell wall biosynthesis